MTAPAPPLPSRGAFGVKMAKRSTKTPWHLTPAAHESYLVARAEAQTRANATGRDIGLEANDLFKTWSSFMLPAEKFRTGHELRCEVVRSEVIRAVTA